MDQRVKARIEIEKRWLQSKGLGNENETRGNRDQSSGTVLHRV